jgi:hypothetical protein
VKLALVIHQHGMEVALFARRGLGWVCRQRSEQVVRDDEASTALSEQLGSLLRPLIISWGIKPGTPVLLATNHGLGGILTAPVKADDTTADAVDALIASQLPHQRSEIASVAQRSGTPPNETLVLNWLPGGWLNDVRDSLARLGLRLEESFPVAHLLAGVAQPAKHGRKVLVVERSHQLGLWAMRPSGEIDACAQLDLRQAGLASRLGLALMGLSAESGATIIGSGLSESTTQLLQQAGYAPTLREPLADLPVRLFQHWLSGGAGWWQSPPREWLLARVTPALIGLAAMLIGSIAYLGWDTERLTDETAKLEASAEKLRPNYRRLDAKQRDLLHMRSALIDNESFRTHQSALGGLAALTAVLPMGSWVSHYHSDSRTVTAEGMGIDNQTLISLLAKVGWTATATAAPAPADTTHTDSHTTTTAKQDASSPPSFKLELHERPAKAR